MTANEVPQQYIPKSALVAEIERLRKNQRLDDRHGQGVLDGLHAIERFIDTLEVKEINLEKELDYDDYINFFNEHPDYNNNEWGFDEAWMFANYFFKLGLKAQKGE